MQGPVDASSCSLEWRPLAGQTCTPYCLFSYAPAGWQSAPVALPAAALGSQRARRRTVWQQQWMAAHTAPSLCSSDTQGQPREGLALGQAATMAEHRASAAGVGTMLTAGRLAAAAHPCSMTEQGPSQPSAVA